MLAGDEGAFSTVYRALTPPLLRYLRSLVGEDAEDVAAETWLNVVRDLRSFRTLPGHAEGDSFRAWVARIGRNRSLDLLRARARRPTESLRDEEAELLAAQADTALAAIEALDTDAALRLIASLPSDQAEAVLLRAVLGLDPAAAGSVLGKSAGAVRVNAHRGLRRLAIVLAEAARQADSPARVNQADGGQGK